MDCPESEILENLCGDGVVTVKKIQFRKNGKDLPTKHVILAFQKNKSTTVCEGGVTCTAGCVRTSLTPDVAFSAGDMDITLIPVVENVLVQNVQTPNTTLKGFQGHTLCVRTTTVLPLCTYFSPIPTRNALTRFYCNLMVKQQAP